MGALGTRVVVAGRGTGPAHVPPRRRCAIPLRRGVIVHSSAGPHLVGKQGPQRPRRAREGAGGYWTLGAVQALAAPVRLDVDRVAWSDERGHVRDRVVHDVAVTVFTLDVQRLVEVHGPGWVDGGAAAGRCGRRRAASARPRLPPRRPRPPPAGSRGSPRAPRWIRATPSLSCRGVAWPPIWGPHADHAAHPHATAPLTTRALLGWSPVLILLPPSESKTVPRRGKPLDLGGTVPGPS